MPNCGMQKWDVNGESCCGLFAEVPISRGEAVRLVYALSKSKAKWYHSGTDKSGRIWSSSGGGLGQRYIYIEI
ncbi:hypothetical protein GQ600_19260 [Phytophthora cactorum]|nr:hypothetical protein GQ600_19260 [Phytophthora cactorum]